MDCNVYSIKWVLNCMKMNYVYDYYVVKLNYGIISKLIIYTKWGTYKYVWLFVIIHK